MHGLGDAALQMMSKGNAARGRAGDSICAGHERNKLAVIADVLIASDGVGVANIVKKNGTCIDAGPGGCPANHITNINISYGLNSRNEVGRGAEERDMTTIWCDDGRFRTATRCCAGGIGRDRSEADIRGGERLQVAKENVRDFVCVSGGEIVCCADESHVTTIRRHHCITGHAIARVSIRGNTGEVSYAIQEIADKNIADIVGVIINQIAGCAFKQSILAIRGNPNRPGIPVATVGSGVIVAGDGRVNRGSLLAAARIANPTGDTT